MCGRISCSSIELGLGHFEALQCQDPDFPSRISCCSEMINSDQLISGLNVVADMLSTWGPNWALALKPLPTFIHIWSSKGGMYLPRCGLISAPWICLNTWACLDSGREDMSWWDSTDAFERVYGKTQSRNWWYATPSILFMNWELLSGLLTDSIVKTCQHSAVCNNVKGGWHVSTVAASHFLPRIDMMMADDANGSQGSNPTMLEHPRKLHFLHCFETTFPPPCSSVTWELLHFDHSHDQRNRFVAV